MNGSHRDTRSKEQLKEDGDYTPAYWRQLKAERGWALTPHGQNKPPTHRESRPGRRIRKGTPRREAA